MANDKIARKEEGTVLEEFCEGIGYGGGMLVGVVAGAVSGAVVLATSGGDWNGAKGKFSAVTDKCIKEGSKVGRKHMPGVTLGMLLTSVIGIIKLRR